MNVDPLVTNGDMWCDLCGEEPIAAITRDGVGACLSCAEKELHRIAEDPVAPFVNRSMIRAMRRGQKKRGAGVTRPYREGRST